MYKQNPQKSKACKYVDYSGLNKVMFLFYFTHLRCFPSDITLLKFFKFEDVHS